MSGVPRSLDGVTPGLGVPGVGGKAGLCYGSAMGLPRLGALGLGCSGGP